jgi:hypothetical protein
MATMNSSAHTGDAARNERDISIPPSTRPQPQPWTKPEDREGWEVIARGRHRKNRPPVGTALFVELSRKQAAWVEAAATAAGVTQVEIVCRLIDQASTAKVEASEAAG